MVSSTKQIFYGNWLPLKNIVNIGERGREKGEKEGKQGTKKEEGRGKILRSLCPG